MKFPFQRGQALPEYLFGTAGVVLLALAGLRLFHDALNNQWSTLTTWLTLPNP